jgi:hypothetical protein
MFTYRYVLIPNVAERRFYDKLRQKMKLRQDVSDVRMGMTYISLINNS